MSKIRLWVLIGFLGLVVVPAGVAAQETGISYEENLAIQANKTCSSDASCAVNEYCYQPPMPACPEGMACAQVMPTRVCRYKKIASEGQMCGGIAGIMCGEGLRCEYGLMPEKLPQGVTTSKIIADGSGICVKVTTGINCGWCGTGCADTRLKMACPMIAPPEGKSCLNVGGKCTIVTNPQKPCGSDRDCGANAYCYQPPMPSCPPGAMCKMMMPARVCKECIPRPTCLDGERDATGKVVYCMGKPGIVYCPKPTVSPYPCGFCGGSCTRIDPRMDCAAGGPLGGAKCVEEAGKCVVKKPTAGEGQMCGGIAGIMCAPGLRCDYGNKVRTVTGTAGAVEKMVADGSGICVKDTVLKCEWCGTGCRATSAVAGACPEIAPPGDKVCVPENGACVVKPKSPTPTCIPRPSCLDANPACMMKIPEGGYFCPKPTCIPRPDCMDGIKDANGNVVYCDPRPGVVYCPVNKGGDANGDGKTDLVDFTIWKKEYLARLIAKADFNKDGKVDLVDFTVWKNNYLRILRTMTTDSKADVQN